MGEQLQCKFEVRRAEDETIIVAILRDARLDDQRLSLCADRQIMDLSLDRARRSRASARRYFIDFNRQALNAIRAKLIQWGIAPSSFPWPPNGRRHQIGAWKPFFTFCVL